MRIHRLFLGFAAAALVFSAGSAKAQTILVPQDFSSIQAAIDAATAGATVLVSPGVYNEDIDFSGKAISLVGSGEDTVITGSGSSPVVTFSSGEGASSVLDSFKITGGNSNFGGGIYVSDASPTILRNHVTNNLAGSAGSGVYIVGATAAPQLYNNLITYNIAAGFGDPHAIQVAGASPLLVNNTIARNDSNGIFTTGSGIAIAINNIIGLNGKKTSEVRKGRGICDFTNQTVLDHNIFYRNRKAAILTGGSDFRRIRKAQRRLERDDITNNIDKNPRFVRRRARPNPADATAADFELDMEGRVSRAIHAGNPDPAYDNLDGSRNTVGHTGGPLAAP